MCTSGCTMLFFFHAYIYMYKFCGVQFCGKAIFNKKKNHCNTYLIWLRSLCSVSAECSSEVGEYCDWTVLTWAYQVSASFHSLMLM